MLYSKNVPNLERAFRILLGIVFVGMALFGGGAPLLIGVLLFSALFVIVTGFVGWCPACAMLGRKLKAKSGH